jgi:hypothetical protein
MPGSISSDQLLLKAAVGGSPLRSSPATYSLVSARNVDCGLARSIGCTGNGAQNRFERLDRWWNASAIQSVMSP